MKLSQVQQALKKNQEKMNSDISEIYKQTSDQLEKDLKQSWIDMQKRIEENFKMKKSKQIETIEQVIIDYQTQNKIWIMGIGSLIGIVIGLVIMYMIQPSINQNRIIQDNLIIKNSDGQEFLNLTKIEQKLHKYEDGTILRYIDLPLKEKEQ